MLAEAAIPPLCERGQARFVRHQFNDVIKQVLNGVGLYSAVFGLESHSGQSRKCIESRVDFLTAKQESGGVAKGQATRKRNRAKYPGSDPRSKRLVATNLKEN